MNCLLNYSNLTVEQLTQVKNDLLASYQNTIDKVLMIPDADLEWSNLVKPFIDLSNNSIDMALLEMKDFYTDSDIRTTCSNHGTEISKWFIDMSMNRDLFAKFNSYHTNRYTVEKKSLDMEEVKYFDDKMIDYKLKGMDLDNDKFEQVKNIKKDIADLCTTFNLNTNNESYFELVERAELTGMSDEYLDAHMDVNNMIRITLKYPDYIPLMENCSNREIRKKFCTLFKSRCMEENTSIIESVFSLRSTLATLLGYTNYSDYKLVKSMAKTTNTVMTFLNELKTKVRPLLDKDMMCLHNLYQEAGNTGMIELWDIPYYSQKFIETTCGFNKDSLKQYFPVNKVISGTFSIYQSLLGFTFTKITDMNHTFWHDSVELYKVSNTGSTGDNDLVGYFYLDLFPREGKYSHAACFPFISKSDSTPPVATMACNFGEGNLTFDEVETFFHEFGHVMHHLSSVSKISDTASFSCEHDFVETPSQMFEEWCYCEDSLKLMSQDLPSDMVVKLNTYRKQLQGYHYSRQLVFGLFDMAIHMNRTDNMTPAELFATIQESILGVRVIPNTSEVASFGHLMGGYDAGYYGYAWSLVYAKDLFSVFKNNLLDPDMGMKLRMEVLSKGSVRDSMESIILFLGREPNNMAFINSLE